MKKFTLKYKYLGLDTYYELKIFCFEIVCSKCQIHQQQQQKKKINKVKFVEK